MEIQRPFDFHGWSDCVQLRHEGVELVVTTEVGPRVLGLSFEGETNLLVVHPHTAGHKGGAAYTTYGGHRLWIAPEMRPRTFTPDNSPVEVVESDLGLHFLAPVDEFHVQKEIIVSPVQGHAGFRLTHRLWNRGAYPIELAAWSPTQCIPGGVVVWPQAEPIPQSERLLPVRPLVLWGYTRMDDPRYRFGGATVQVEWMDLPPTKVGMQVEQGIAAYSVHGVTFVKRFDFADGASYPDMGSNFELFTRKDIVEVESLGPLVSVMPGEHTQHVENWYLLRGEVPRQDAEAKAWLDYQQMALPLQS